MTTFHATVTHHEAHFNPVAYSNIPEYWECELDEIPEKSQAVLGTPGRFSHIHIYGTGETRALAIEDLTDQLKGHDLHGTLKISG